MIKMLVSSFYNTIIDEEDAIPTSTMFAIDYMRKNNILLTITTNRLQDEVLYYNHDYPFIDYVISLNGSILYDVNHNKTVELRSFTKKEVEEIRQLFVNKKILYYTKDKVWDTIPQETVYKIEIKGVKEWKNDNYHISILKRDKENFLEISKNTPYDALKKLKIKDNEIISIIGNDSEEPILDNIENTYVMRNASKTLKDKTTRLTKSNKNKGVEAVIKKEIK